MPLLHTCVGQIKVAEGYSEPPAPKCSCRKELSIENATKLVKRGEASWVVVKRTRGPVKETCHLCHGDKSVVNCASCGGGGAELKDRTWDTYNNDVVIVSELPADKRERKRSSILAKKTPRTPTIEHKHIIRAYVDEDQDAMDRIEEYGNMQQQVLHKLGAQLRDRKTGEIIFDGKSEPADDIKSGTGRAFDYGRAI